MYRYVGTDVLSFSMYRYMYVGRLYITRSGYRCTKNIPVWVQMYYEYLSVSTEELRISLYVGRAVQRVVPTTTVGSLSTVYFLMH